MGEKAFVVTRINWYGPDYDFSNCIPVRVFTGPEAEEKANAYVKKQSEANRQEVTYQVDDCSIE